MKIKTENYKFRLTKTAVWLCKDGKNDLILCDYVLPTKLGHSSDRNQWFLFLKFRDRLGETRSVWVPMEKASQRGYLIRELLSRGMKFSPSVPEAAFLEFIQAVEPTEVVIIYPSTGWVNDNLFLRGRHAVGKGDGTSVLAPSIADTVRCIHANGTLEKWQTRVGELCLSSRFLIVSICTAFSAPLCEIAGVEGGGIHLYGETSIGKSTCLIAAASVFGNPKRYVESWKTTEVGAEETAGKYNSLLLCIDELKQLSANKKKAAEIATDVSYLFGNGRPKTRGRGYESMNGGRQPSFCVSILSSGEPSFSDIASDAGWARRGGEEIRISDLAADNNNGLGIYDYIPEDIESPQKLSEKVTKEAGKFYGTPFKVFMEQLIGTLSPTKRRRRVNKYLNAFLKAAKANERIVFNHRFAKRFAVIYAGGMMAVKFGVLNWSQEEIFNAIMSAYETACFDRQSTSEDQVKRVVELVRRNIRNGTGIVGFSDEGGCETDESAFKNHQGLKLRDAEGKLIAYKIRGEIIRDWCGSKRMADAAIDWFTDHEFLKEKPNRHQGDQDRTRKVGKTKNRYRYFTFSPKVAKIRKPGKKR